ncbi:hypothetical protein CR513_33438, partial [Mucuna pruriens]
MDMAPAYNCSQKMWQSSSICLYAYVELKKRLTLALVLVLPNSSETFVVYCDASKMGLSGVLICIIDDILVYSKSREEDAKHLKVMLQVLKDK